MRNLTPNLVRRGNAIANEGLRTRFVLGRCRKIKGEVGSEK